MAKHKGKQPKEMAIQPHQIHLELLLSKWQEDVAENPHFQDSILNTSDDSLPMAKAFLDHLLKTLGTPSFPECLCSPKLLDPVLQLWHRIINELSNKGLNSKETALLILSLKSSIASYADDLSSSPQEHQQLSKLSHLLDFLGVLSFELYSAEKDKLISRQQQQLDYLQEVHHFDTLIGSSPKMLAVYKAIGLVLENNVTVLLEGETGTGKDLIAVTIHQYSKRKKKPFITLNCGAIPKDLIESELFGHEKGAFTGAHEQKLGKFELADGSTLFLDEISELNIDLQVKLLRALQNQEIERVGGTEKISIDVRIIAATNKNLLEEIEKGHFRHDLYYRINVFPILVPPLKDRGDDVIALATHFIKRYAKQLQTSEKPLSLDAETFLRQYPWEGNVRELENLIQRALLLCQEDTITQAHFLLHPSHIGHSTQAPELLAASYTEIMEVRPLDDIEKDAITQALHTKQGNIKQVAIALGISRTTLYNKAKKYGIDLNASR